MDTKAYIDGLVEKARKAQQEFEKYDQKQVDAVVKAVGMAVYEKGEELAKLAVEESGMGKYEHKIVKNKMKAVATWNYLKDKKSVGVIEYDEVSGIAKVAKPIGVIGAITPVTNPVMTPNHNAMITLKGRNAIIICPHPAGKRAGIATVKAMNDALDKIGAPKNLIQIVEEPTIEASAMVMSECDCCIATGGPGMVKAAYSSGKPAFGVGAGNCQCLIDKDADIKDLVPKVITGRTYDNGVLCTCEQSVIAPEEKYDELIEEFKANKAYYVSEKADVDALRDAILPDGALNKKAVGLSPLEIAKLAGLSIPEDTSCLVVKVDKAGVADAFGQEKLFPVLAAYKYKTWEECVDIAIANLEYMGKGHSISMHSFTKKNIEYAAERIPVSRFLVNGIGSSGLGGAWTNSLVPTGTLGCGSWGNNSISENLSYIHLINISRIAYTQPDRKIPTPEEVWAD